MATFSPGLQQRRRVRATWKRPVVPRLEWNTINDVNVRHLSTTSVVRSADEIQPEKKRETENRDKDVWEELLASNRKKQLLKIGNEMQFGGSDA